jgi:hypothetical protein
MHVVSLNQGSLRTASFAARLRRLRIAYRDGAIRDFADIPPALFDALIRSTDPETFVRDRVEGQYDEKIVRSA